MASVTFKETSASEFPAIDQLIKGFWIQTGAIAAGAIPAGEAASKKWKLGGAARGHRNSRDHQDAMEWYTEQRHHWGENNVPKPAGLNSTAMPSSSMMSMGGGGGQGSGWRSRGNMGGGPAVNTPIPPASYARSRGGPSASAPAPAPTQAQAPPATNFDFYGDEA